MRKTTTNPPDNIKRGENNKGKEVELHPDLGSDIFVVINGTGKAEEGLELRISENNLQYRLFDPDGAITGWTIFNSDSLSDKKILSVLIQKQFSLSLEEATAQTEAVCSRRVKFLAAMAQQAKMVILEKSDFGSKYAEVSDNALKLITETEKKGKTYTKEVIVVRNFKPTKRIELDGETVFEAKSGRSIRGNIKEILEELSKNGQISNRAAAPDCISSILTGLNIPTIKGHATYGVYPQGDSLEFCTEPLTRSDSHKKIKREIDKYKDIEITQENFLKWVELTKFWNLYEILPIMGLSAIAPFSFVLRDKGVMVPYIYHLSQDSGLGKSELMRVFTTYLFGHVLLTADGINSPFRLSDSIDSFGGLLGVEEAESFKWERFSPHLQASAEQPQQDSRGTGSLNMRPYFSRAVLGFSGNSFPTRRKALLVRFIVVEFDRTAKTQRRKLSNRKSLKTIERSLKRIGFELVRAELEAVKTAEELVKRIESHAEELEKIYAGDFKDPRRANAWGLIYEGLKVWERLAEKLKVDWQTLSYEEFVAEVINKIEFEAFNQVEPLVANFKAWWQAWKALNTQIKGDGIQIKGEGEIWREYTVEFDGREIKGDIISKPVLSLYEKENRGKISISLMDINKGIGALYGISFADLPKIFRINNKPMKVAFVPDNEPESELKLEKPDKNDKAEDKAEKLQGVLELGKELTGRLEYFNVVEISKRLELSEKDIEHELDRLLKKGKVKEISPGRWKA